MTTVSATRHIDAPLNRVFETLSNAGQTVMAMTMDCRPYRLLARLANLVIMVMVRNAVESDMDSVNAYCEGTSRQSVTA